MNLLLRLSIIFIVPCLIAGTSAGQAPPVGGIKVSFNDGNAFVDTARDGQSFYAHICRNKGPQRTDQAYGFGGYVESGSALGGAVGSTRLLGGGLAQLFDVDDRIVGSVPPLPGTLRGCVYSGDALFFAGTYPRGDGTFEADFVGWYSDRGFIRPLATRRSDSEEALHILQTHPSLVYEDPRTYIYLATVVLLSDPSCTARLLGRLALWTASRSPPTPQGSSGYRGRTPRNAIRPSGN